MARRSTRKTLTVAMNGLRVGRLTRESNSILRFEYSASWLAEDAAVPISLSIPLAAEPRSDPAIARYFENLLPDSADIRERLQRAVGAESTRAFDLLLEIGKDCVGALQLHEGDDPPDVRSIEAEPWTAAQVAEHLRELRRPGRSRRTDRRPFRISIAGSQDKTALLLHEGQWCRPLGPTPTTHILKPATGPTPGGIDLTESVENEWLCAQVVRAFGLDVARSEIVSFDEETVLVVERFDRRLARDANWWIRVPQEDMCQAQAIGPDRKYEVDGGPDMRSILRLLSGAQDPIADRKAFFRAQVVYWLLAAIDGHGKNFSLFLEPGGAYRSTPLYDILSAHPAVAAGQLHERELEMAMALRGKNKHYGWRELQYRHWLQTAARGGLREGIADQILRDVISLAPVVAAEVGAASADITSRVRDPILEGIVHSAERLERQRDASE